MPWVNVGKMNNQGFDGTIEYEQQIGEVQLTARGNFTYARSEIIDNDEPDWKHKYQNRIGKPYGQSFGLKALGLFQSQEEIDNSPTQTYGTVRVGDTNTRILMATVRLMLTTRWPSVILPCRRLTMVSVQRLPGKVLT